MFSRLVLIALKQQHLFIILTVWRFIAKGVANMQKTEHAVDNSYSTALPTYRCNLANRINICCIADPHAANKMDRVAIH